MPWSAWALAICFISALPSPLQAGNTAVTEKQQNLDKLQARIKQLTGSLTADRDRLDSFQKALRDIELKISQVAFTLKDLGGNLERRRKMLTKLQSQEKNQQASLQQHRKLLARQMRAAYAMGRQERLKILLNQEDPERLGRLFKYHDYINRERARQLIQLKEILAGLADTRNNITGEEQRIQDLLQQGQLRKQDLERSKQERDKLLQRLAREIIDKDKELQSLKQNEQDLQTLIQQLQQAMAELAEQRKQTKDFKRLEGKLHWPLAGKLGAVFGSPRSSGLTWDGVFIQARAGTEVKAVHQGRVAYADWLRGFGLLLIIDHGEGFMSLYGHNQSLFKAVGDPVDTGEAIAQAGNGGGSLNSGIYFGFRHQGKPLDPAHWCKARDQRPRR